MSLTQKNAELKQSVLFERRQFKELALLADGVVSDVWRCIDAAIIEGTPVEQSLNELSAFLRSQSKQPAKGEGE